MATDVLTTTVAPPPSSHRPFPRGLAISDLDLPDDRYPVLSSPRHVPPAIQQGAPSSDIIPSHTPFYPDAVHQAVRGPSDLPPYNLNMSSLKLTPDDRGLVQHPDHQSTPLTVGSPPNSFPLDHKQPINGSSSVNEINLQFFGPSQASQTSSGELSKPPPAAADPPLSSQQPRPLQPVSPWQNSPRDPQLLESHSPSPRSGGVASQAPSIALPSPLSPGMRISSTAQYSPAMVVPVVSPNPRVQAQQPTYITPTPAPKPINPVFTTQPLPPEEVCVECAMRDQDMADVDVTSLGIWARESDIHYEDLLRRELEEEAMGVPPPDLQRPRARGGRLTEANLKLWLTMNPKGPASKNEALDRYVKTQQTLVEAEALAHARALQESRQLEDRMRDAYSQLRRSAYELGVTTSSDDRGVRIKTTRSSMIPLPTQTTGHGREVTVLENGMIVEHVDVRKEEREERQQRRLEEKRARARKSSRGSAIDVASMYSTMSPLSYTDSGLPLLPSRSSTSRPMSVLTAPMDTRGLQSNASVEALSMISAGTSPNRRTRFFGTRNLSPGLRSSDSLAPSGFSGSMVDMHIALQHGGERMPHSPADTTDRYQTINSWRNGAALAPQRAFEQPPEDKPKKKNGLAKIWRLVTGSSKNDVDPSTINISHARSLDRAHDDDYPLAPPPPLSYLVSRGTGDNGGSALRHVSTPSLPSSASPNYPLSSAGMSPPTAPSSLLPSPTSSRPVVISELSDGRKALLADSDAEQPSFTPEEERLRASTTQRGVHPTTSEPDLRRRASQVQIGPVPPVPRIPTSVSQAAPPQASSGWRDKMLPPLPGEVQLRAPVHAQTELRPRTLFSYDMREVNGGQALTAPQAPFSRAEMRRQSFNGLSNPPSGLVVQTMPARRADFDSEKYGEFGASRGVLVPSSLQAPQPAKRKSKFGFASLLGRKTSTPVQDPEPVEFPLGRGSGSEARHEAEMGMHYGNTMTNGEAGQGHVFPRLSMSLTTRKNIEALVDQSPDFVSYRYPSGDQNMQLLR
ncbi:hypothetical protein EDB92DRAFT_1798874 [Lactarius akahatsu]|uniref:Proteophosphoglycan ppg4 n=1 Tax=Lactarius akahatsu TaxID=416441 RepID=A0AAD4LGB9_9AGAM|nr:hypothetical protein EDB92DRAFT_1798874 [Lactarius akahatsu]